MQNKQALAYPGVGHRLPSAGGDDALRICIFNEIVKRLELQKQHEILAQLQLAVTVKEKQRQKKYRVFEVSSDINHCIQKNFYFKN